MSVAASFGQYIIFITFASHCGTSEIEQNILLLAQSPSIGRRCAGQYCDPSKDLQDRAGRDMDEAGLRM